MGPASTGTGTMGSSPPTHPLRRLVTARAQQDNALAAFAAPSPHALHLAELGVAAALAIPGPSLGNWCRSVLGILAAMI